MRNILVEFSIHESSKRITPLIQTLKQEFKAVVFEKDELEYRSMSIRITLLNFLADQDSDSDVPTSFYDFQKLSSPPQRKNYRLTT